MLVLGIETSCDETAAALVTDDRRVLANIVRSQLTDHAPYGGVVPEIAARAHLDHLGPVVEGAFAEAGVGRNAIDAVAATTGPGLIGGIIVGSMAAKAMAAALGRPFVAVNHLEGHALTGRLTDDLAFPYLLLLASGGHCQLVAVEAVGRYRRLGGTVDDAIGEAFDKTAKMLGLGHPGGPAVERAAANGDPGRFALPRPFLGRPGADFSFSGLKTAVRQRIEALPADSFDDQTLADMAAAFQEAVADVVVDRTRNAATAFAVTHGPGRPLVIAGGVAANRRLRAALTGLADELGIDLVAPPLELCTDNGAMIAWAGIERLRLGHPGRLDAAPRPRWPLDAPDMALDGMSAMEAAP